MTHEDWIGLMKLAHVRLADANALLGDPKAAPRTAGFHAGAASVAGPVFVEATWAIGAPDGPEGDGLRGRSLRHIGRILESHATLKVDMPTHGDEYAEAYERGMHATVQAMRRYLDRRAAPQGEGVS